MLHLFARMRGARRILEVGTLGGYSTIWLARALPQGGTLVTLEFDPNHAGVARRNVDDAGVGHLVDIRVGPAFDTLDLMVATGEGPFDLVFIDADKANNVAYLHAALALAQPGTAIVVDNVIREGLVLDATSGDERVMGTRRLFEALAAEPRLIGDGGADGGYQELGRIPACGGAMIDDPLDPDFAAPVRARAAAAAVPALSGLAARRRRRFSRSGSQQALDGGPVAAFQFRVKGVDQHEAARLAEPLQRICAERDVAFIVNDDMALAKRLGADGVHLGQGDGDPREARALLGPGAQIGVTCHDSRHLAMEAGEAGADYVAFGAFFPTDDQGDAAPARPVDPVLVVDPVRDPLRRDRRHHAGQWPGRWSRPAPTSSPCAARSGTIRTARPRR